MNQAQTLNVPWALIQLGWDPADPSRITISLEPGEPGQDLAAIDALASLEADWATFGDHSAFGFKRFCYLVAAHFTFGPSSA